MNPAVRTLDYRLAVPEPAYRSEGEAQVGRVLQRYAIPFVHEQPTWIRDRGRYRIWRPDFTLPEHGNLIIEYAGMMDRLDYAVGILHKQASYQANGRNALFFYPEDLRGQVWPQRLIARIEAECARRAPR